MFINKIVKVVAGAVILFLAGAGELFAQDQIQQTAGKIPKLVTDPMNYVILLTIVVLVSTILVMARVIRLLTWQLAGSPPPRPAGKKDSVIRETKPSWWTRMNRSLSDAVPVEKEADVLLDHEYDGIRELDNNLPPWWKYGFYLTIIFSVFYMLHYHVVGSGNVQLDEYQEQLAAAEIEKEERLKYAAASVDENTATVMDDEQNLLVGKKIYNEKCLVCHGTSGEGNVGPNLTDEYWLHGGSMHDIFKIIKYGFTSKGMIAWQGQLSPVEIQQVSSFIYRMKGTNPPNQKEPQGEIFREGPKAVPEADSAKVSIG
jgi:cytochrome c oxidase cbb3-type subunit III